MTAFLLYLINTAINTNILFNRFKVSKEHEVIKTAMKVIHHIVEVREFL